MENNLGEYKVVITASYEEMAEKLQKVTQIIKESAENIAQSMTDITTNAVTGLNKIPDAVKEVVSQSSKLGDVSKHVEGMGDAATKTAEKYKSLQQQLREANMAAEKAFGTYAFDAAHDKVGEILTQINTLKAAMNDVNVGAKLNADSDRSGMVAELTHAKQASLQAARDSARMDKEYYAAKEAGEKRSSELIRQGMMDRVKAEEAAQAATRKEAEEVARLTKQYDILIQRVRDYNESKTQMSRLAFTQNKNKIGDLISQIGNKDADAAKYLFNPLTSYGDYSKYAESFEKVTKAQNNMTTGFSKIAGAATGAATKMDLFDSVASKVNSHIAWMASATFVAGLIGIPVAINSVIESTDALNAKIQQNLELSDRYQGNTAKLKADMQTLNTTAQQYATGFGMSMTEVQDAMQILSRRFKDVASIQYLTHTALTMSRLDMVDTKKSAQDLEAVMLQFGLNAEGTNQFLNDFTVAVHTARISGTDLLDALERSGTSFKNFGMDTRSSIAAVAALSTETARAGSTIGTSFKSIAANFDMKNAVKALKDYNIELYTVDENGRKTIRDGANVFQELQNLFQQLDDEGRRNLAMSLAGGKYQVNQLMAFLEDANGNFTKFMSEMKNKSSDAMTRQLLAVSMDTYATRLAQLRASFQVLAQTIGNMFLPKLKEAVIWLTAVSNVAKNHASGIADLFKAIILLGGAYLALETYAKLATVATTLYNIATATSTALTAGLTVAVDGQTVATTAGNVAIAIKCGLLGTEAGFLTGNAALMLAYNAAVVAGSVANFAMTGSTYALAGAFGVLSAAIYSIPLVGWIAAAISAILVLLYFLYTDYSGTVNKMKEIWNGFIENMVHLLQGFMSIFPMFWDNAIAPILNWAAKALGIVARLDDKVTEHAVHMANALAAALSMDVPNSVGGSKRLFNGDTEMSELDLQRARAKRDADAMLANVKNIAGNMPSGGIGDGGGGTGGGGSGGAGESPYKQAKDRYEQELAKEKYQSEAVENKKFTTNDELYLYNQYLADVEKDEKEETEFLKGQYDLRTKWYKESLDLQKSQLETQIADKAISQLDYLNGLIRIANIEHSLTLQGSKEREEAERKIIDAYKKRDDYVRDIAKKEGDLQKSFVKNIDSLRDKLVDFYAKIGAVSEDQKLKYKWNANEEDFGTVNKENKAGVARTAQDGKTKQMEAAYDEFMRARTEGERQLAVEHAVAVSKEEKETLKYLQTAEKAWENYTKKRLDLETQIYERTHRYQLAIAGSLKSGLSQAFQDILNRTKSFGQALRSVFTGIWKSVVTTFSNDLANKITQGLEQFLMKSRSAGVQVVTVVQNTAQQIGIIGQQDLTLHESFEASKVAVVTTSNAEMTASNQQMAATSSASMGAMMAQMLAMLAIMAIFSSFFGGGDDESTSTQDIALGRNPASYYSTPTTVPQITVPSFDIGAANVPQDMLAMVHKDEMVLPADLAENIRSMNSQDARASNTGPVIIKSNFAPNLIDSRGIKDVYHQTNRDMAKQMKVAYRRFEKV